MINIMKANNLNKLIAQVKYLLKKENRRQIEPENLNSNKIQEIKKPIYKVNKWWDTGDLVKYKVSKN